MWDKDGFADFADRVMESLAELDCEDPDVTVDLGEGIATFEFKVLDTELLNGLLKAIAIVRTALHMAGAGTTVWKSLTGEITQSLELHASLEDDEGRLASA